MKKMIQDDIHDDEVEDEVVINLILNEMDQVQKRKILHLQKTSSLKRMSISLLQKG
jgi:hypothetical protein